jgi:HSP20 family molecular chaperone IbpA
MALFPFQRYRFFDDPFYFHHYDFFNPWYDFDIVPSFTPSTPRLRSVKEQERLTYTTTTTTTNASNNANSLQLPTRAAEPEKFRVQLNIDGFNPDKIQTRIEGRRLIAEGKQEDLPQRQDYTIREIQASYQLRKVIIYPKLITRNQSPNKIPISGF